MNEYFEAPAAVIGYPPALRTALAQLELAHERGALDEQAYTTAVQVATNAARAAMNVPADYDNEPCPMGTQHNPTGRQMVWWKVVL